MSRLGSALRVGADTCSGERDGENWEWSRDDDKVGEASLGKDARRNLMGLGRRRDYQSIHRCEMDGVLPGEGMDGTADCCYARNCERGTEGGKKRWEWERQTRISAWLSLSWACQACDEGETSGLGYRGYLGLGGSWAGQEVPGTASRLWDMGGGAGLLRSGTMRAKERLGKPHLPGPVGMRDGKRLELCGAGRMTCWRWKQAADCRGAEMFNVVAMEESRR